MGNVYAMLEELERRGRRADFQKNFFSTMAMLARFYKMRIGVEMLFYEGR